jgi:REP element-mobilizing transposase RayT
MSRGNGKMRIFLTEADYRKFLYVLGDVVDEYDVECWDFCLMPNHYHLALLNRQPNLSEAIRHLNGEYGLWWNASHRRVGHVFQGRFKDQIVQRDGYLDTLIRYIALNPVRARLVDHPAKWKWGAYRCLAGLCPEPGFLSDGILRHLGAGDDGSPRQSYAKHVLMASSDYDVMAERLRSKERVLGDQGFKRAVLATAAIGEMPPTNHRGVLVSGVDGEVTSESSANRGMIVADAAGGGVGCSG